MTITLKKNNFFFNYRVLVISLCPNYNDEPSSFKGFMHASGMFSVKVPSFAVLKRDSVNLRVS